MGVITCVFFKLGLERKNCIIILFDIVYTSNPVTYLRGLVDNVLNREQLNEWVGNCLVNKRTWKWRNSILIQWLKNHFTSMPILLVIYVKWDILLKFKILKEIYTVLHISESKESRRQMFLAKDLPWGCNHDVGLGSHHLRAWMS